MSGSFDRVRVLIVEDNPHMSKILRVTLQGFGVRIIEECRDAETAIDSLGAFNPDMAVVDYMLGEMNGLEFTRYIRTSESSPNKYLPVLMVTGYTDRSRVIEAINAGVNEFLAKPVRPVDLYQRLIAMIERPRRFVRVPDYFGPDRRRRQDPRFHGPWKRARDEQKSEIQTSDEGEDSDAA
jgi:DNA-binding response OmpR family regulator